MLGEEPRKPKVASPRAFDSNACADSKILKFSAYQYRYGRGIHGIAIKLANVSLLLHVALCVSQAARNLWSGRTYCLVGSIGEIIVLAMNLTPRERLRNTCAGIHSLSTWKKNVVVRETKIDMIKLVFEDGSDDEQLGIVPQPGKIYR